MTTVDAKHLAEQRAGWLRAVEGNAKEAARCHRDGALVNAAALLCHNVMFLRALDLPDDATAAVRLAWEYLGAELGAVAADSETPP